MGSAVASKTDFFFQLLQRCAVILTLKLLSFTVGIFSQLEVTDDQILSTRLVHWEADDFPCFFSIEGYKLLLQCFLLFFISNFTVLL